MVGEQELPFESPKGTRRVLQSGCIVCIYGFMWSNENACRSAADHAVGKLIAARCFLSVCLPLCGGVRPAGEGGGAGPVDGDGV